MTWLTFLDSYEAMNNGAEVAEEEYNAASMGYTDHYVKDNSYYAQPHQQQRTQE